MRHLSPFALLGVLALASAQSSADSTVGGTRRRLLNEKTALPHPKRVLSESLYPVEAVHYKDNVAYCEYLDSGFCMASQNQRWGFTPKSYNVTTATQALNTCTQLVGQDLTVAVGWPYAVDTTTLVAVEFNEVQNEAYCVFTCPGMTTHVEYYANYEDGPRAGPFHFLIAVGAAPEGSSFLAPCLAPPAPPSSPPSSPPLPSTPPSSPPLPSTPPSPPSPPSTPPSPPSPPSTPPPPSLPPGSLHPVEAVHYKDNVAYCEYLDSGFCMASQNQRWGFTPKSYNVTTATQALNTCTQLVGQDLTVAVGWPYAVDTTTLVAVEFNEVQNEAYCVFTCPGMTTHVEYYANYEDGPRAGPFHFLIAVGAAPEGSSFLAPCLAPPAPPSSPPPSLPPSPPPPDLLLLSMTAAGTVEEIDEAQQTSMRQTIANETGVDVENVSLEITAASVNILAYIMVPVTMAVATVQSALETSFATADAASNLLGVTVESEPQVAQASPPSSPPSDDKAGIIAGSTVGGVLLLVLVLVLGYYFYRQQSDPSKGTPKTPAV